MSALGAFLRGRLPRGVAPCDAVVPEASSGRGVARHASTATEAALADQDAWKSPQGIDASPGPGWAGDTLVVGATVLDVTPTILAVFGLPLGDDMEGRVLVEGFVKAPAVRRIATWEPAQIATLPSVSEDSGAPDDPGAAVSLRRESDLNLAQS
jgi:hypothetical protein